MDTSVGTGQCLIHRLIHQNLLEEPAMVARTAKHGDLHMMSFCKVVKTQRTSRPYCANSL